MIPIKFFKLILKERMENFMESAWSTVLSLGAEGGGITVLGKEENGQWKFSLKINEIISDDVKQSDHHEIVDSFEQALNLLNAYPWPKLHPLKIHPVFRKSVWNGLQSVKNQYKMEQQQFSRWAELCFPDFSPQLVTLATWILESSHTTVFTGAGMSTESNIPDFRSKDGWWRKIDPRTVATTQALRNNYDLFHEFYRARIETLASCKPHQGHEILAKWEQRGLLQAVSTQNVDGFHAEAGNRHVYELHGSIHKVRCAACGKSAEMKQFLDKEPCPFCGGKLRPGVVLFGEMLPEDSWNASLSHIRKSDLVIVIGTSLEVYPANQLPTMTKGKTVYINAEIEGHSYFDLTIQGKAGEVLKQVDDLLSQMRGQ